MTITIPFDMEHEYKGAFLADYTCFSIRDSCCSIYARKWNREGGPLVTNVRHFH
jgi:hypothetical protein